MKGLLGDYPFVLRNLGLQLLQTLQRGNLHAGVLALPMVEGRLTDTVLPTDVSHRFTTLLQLQDADDLAFRELALFHMLSLFKCSTFYFSVLRFIGGRSVVDDLQILPHIAQLLAYGGFQLRPEPFLLLDDGQVILPRRLTIGSRLHLTI